MTRVLTLVVALLSAGALLVEAHAGGHHHGPHGHGHGTATAHDVRARQLTRKELVRRQKQRREANVDVCIGG